MPLILNGLIDVGRGTREDGFLQSRSIRVGNAAPQTGIQSCDRLGLV